jgi:hypothetical protein
MDLGEKKEAFTESYGLFVPLCLTFSGGTKHHLENTSALKKCTRAQLSLPVGFRLEGRSFGLHLSSGGLEDALRQGLQSLVLPLGYFMGPAFCG